MALPVAAESPRYRGGAEVDVIITQRGVSVPAGNATRDPILDFKIVRFR